MAEEGLKRTENDLIHIGCPIPFDTDEFLGELDDLMEAAYKNRDDIDEYDVPLDKAYQNGYYREMVSLIRSLFGNALKTNEFLQFAVLTGCLRVSKGKYIYRPE